MQHPLLEKKIIGTTVFYDIRNWRDTQSGNSNRNINSTGNFDPSILIKCPFSTLLFFNPSILIKCPLPHRGLAAGCVHQVVNQIPFPSFPFILKYTLENLVILGWLSYSKFDAIDSKGRRSFMVVKTNNCHRNTTHSYMMIHIQSSNAREKPTTLS